MDTEKRIELEKRLVTLEVSFGMVRKTIGALALAVIASLAGHFVDEEVETVLGEDKREERLDVK